MKNWINTNTTVAAIVFLIACWALSQLYTSFTNNIKAQEDKLYLMEKAICSKHPKICKDL